MTNEYAHTDDSIDIAEVARKIWAKQLFVTILTLFGSILAVIIAFTIPNTFETTVRLQPPTESDIRALNHLSPSPVLVASLNPETELAKRLSPLVSKDFNADDVFNRFISNIASRKLQIRALDQIDTGNVLVINSEESSFNKKQAYAALLGGLSIQLSTSTNKTGRYATDSDTVISFRH